MVCYGQYVLLRGNIVLNKRSRGNLIYKIFLLFFILIILNLRIVMDIREDLRV